MTFAIIGHGTIGRAFHYAAKYHGHECVAIIDPPESIDEGDVHQADYAFVCVPTPGRSDGSCNTGYVRAAVEELVEERRYPGGIVIRSTVPPGTCAELAAEFMPHATERLLMHPEFLRNRDIQNTSRWPDFAIIGTNAPDPELNPFVRHLRKFYEPFFEGVACPPVFLTNWVTAEFTKYVSNALLAGVVTLADELWSVGQPLGVDWNVVFSMAQACRVMPKTVRVDAGARGFEGHCLPKDVAALLSFADEAGVEPTILAHILEHNQTIRREQAEARRAKAIAPD